MSGLFDKGMVGEARLSSASVEDDLTELDAADLLSSLGKDSALDLDVFDMNDLDKTQDEGNDDFMEVFTDLSDMLGGVPGSLDAGQMVSDEDNLLENLVTSPLMEVDDLSPILTAEAGRTRKRTASDDHPANTDHDDYTCKRLRVATPDSTSETVTVQVPKTSTSPTPSCSLTNPQVKYIERRTKNNIASRRSRQTRKQKFVDMEVQAEELELSNEKLRQQVVELEKLTKIMKDILVQKIAHGS